MDWVALVLALAGCVGIIGIGVRFILSPSAATTAFGVAADDLRALTAIKGVRDITSGAVLLVVWVAGGREVLGWTLIAAAITPLGDALIVTRRGGRLAQAVGIHGVTAVAMVAAGLILGLA